MLTPEDKVRAEAMVRKMMEAAKSAVILALAAGVDGEGAAVMIRDKLVAGGWDGVRAANLVRLAVHEIAKDRNLPGYSPDALRQIVSRFANG